ncbi:MAG: bifunctional diaminohydroxyphosphoribosylaminopyrimidine deaminase/5-amino-6-(5-phosphoribosylamino)uracil reductase RibD [Pirellulales bacterium]
MTNRVDDDDRCMARAIALAVQGEGHVEPNPMVGCVVVSDGRIIGEGFHARCGGPHAEIVALEQTGGAARGATLYVTLEPCCHRGKTPPCTAAVIRAGVARVVIASQDPFPQVNGRGIAELKQAGIHCDVGVLGGEARRLIAAYRKLVTTGRPWVIAKWAMTLDGKIATRTGDSRWISSEASRAVVHQLRGRVDAIMIGSGTARSDDPLLTARPADVSDIKRTATRVVVDSAASLSPASRLVQTAGDVPLLVAASEAAADDACKSLIAAGAEVLRCSGSNHAQRVESLLAELGRRQMTNVLVEGGSRLLGTLFEMRAIDEAHVFISPKIVGGEAAPGAIGGAGVDRMADALALGDITIEELDGDVYVHGRVG